MESCTPEKKDKNSKIIEKVLNIIYLILIILYFISLYLIQINYDSNFFIKYFKISSFVLLIVSLITFEIAYKKENIKIGIHGIETLSVSIFTLLIQYMTRVFYVGIQEYIKLCIGITISYYILKIIIKYTNENKQKLDDLSDIKEIVKDKPIKKLTKRKNINNAKD